MAKLADAADLKSAGFNRPWGFKSPSGHQDVEVPRLRSGFRRRAQTPARRLKFKSPSGPQNAMFLFCRGGIGILPAGAKICRFSPSQNHH